MSVDLSRHMKRAFDLALLLVTAPVVVPLGLLVALIVRLSMGAPVLFVQERPGLHGEIFRLRKFRTMRHPVGDLDLDSDERRLTRFGAALRRTSLDELPEFWNIMVGEMSFVGPRPLLVDYLPLYSARQFRRHDVLPGLTGLAQVSGRNRSGWEERLELDVRYVETWSLGADVSILLRTIGQVLRRQDVTEAGHVTRSRFEGTDMSRDESTATTRASEGSRT